MRRLVQLPASATSTLRVLSTTQVTTFEKCIIGISKLPETLTTPKGDEEPEVIAETPFNIFRVRCQGQKRGANCPQYINRDGACTNPECTFTHLEDPENIPAGSIFRLRVEAYDFPIDAAAQAGKLPITMVSAQPYHMFLSLNGYHGLIKQHQARTQMSDRIEFPQTIEEIWQQGFTHLNPVTQRLENSIYKLLPINTPYTVILSQFTPKNSTAHYLTIHEIFPTPRDGDKKKADAMGSLSACGPSHESDNHEADDGSAAKKQKQ